MMNETFATVRTLEAYNSETDMTVQLAVLKDDRGYWLHDLSDVNMDGLDQIADESDGSILDSIGDNGFEIVEEADEDDTLVCGHQIQHDNSGVGHNFRNIDRDDIPADIIEEIEGEILDGKMDSCDDFVAGNGLHYRW